MPYLPKHWKPSGISPTFILSYRHWAMEIKGSRVLSLALLTRPISAHRLCMPTICTTLAIGGLLLLCLISGPTFIKEFDRQVYSLRGLTNAKKCQPNSGDNARLKPVHSGLTIIRYCCDNMALWSSSPRRPLKSTPRPNRFNWHARLTMHAYNIFRLNLTAQFPICPHGLLIKVN